MENINFTSKMRIYTKLRSWKFEFLKSEEVGKFTTWFENLKIKNLSFDLNFILGNREKICFSKS